jgi:outer membrane protein assembly factor BamE
MRQFTVQKDNAASQCRAAMFAPLAFILLCSMSITGCGFVYRIPIQQGNITTKELVTKLTVGMSKNEVRNLLGTALVQDVFHANRWDYIYANAPKGNIRDQHKITLVFDGDKLAKIEGEAPPDVNLRPAG